MKGIIGLNLVCFALTALAVIVEGGGTVKEMVTTILIEVLFMAVFSTGILLMMPE